ncbi:MAG TPA: nuclear transport factor 2 family protein [Gemmatimonadaceae bacterium]|nr:nuclear transport factor 2 family protein [Gemmatimonadaceae bacterium]
MNVPLRRALAAVSLLLAGACAGSPPARETASVPADANARLDTLIARLVTVHHALDAKGYAQLYTDSAVFEWPAFDTVRGRAGIEAMARGNFAPLDDLVIRITPSARRLAADHATEFGAFEETWNDSTGARKAEYGRYAETLARQPDGSYLIDHFLGFEDSTATLSPARADSAHAARPASR